MTRTLSILAILLLSAAAGAFLYLETRSPSLPEITFPDLDGHPQSLRAWRGKVLLVNFWATWCPPCLREIPYLKELQRRYGDKGLQVVGIALDSPAAVRAYVKRHGIDYPILLGGDQGAMLSRELGNRMEVLPFTAVIDRRGKLVLNKAGEIDAAWAKDHLLPLL